MSEQEQSENSSTEASGKASGETAQSQASVSTAKQANSNKLLRFLLLIVVPIAAVIGAGFVWLQGGRYVATENAYVKAHIAHVSSELDGRVSFVAVDDHARVMAGDILVELDQAAIKVTIARTNAEVDAARGQIRTLLATLDETRSELADWQGRQKFLQNQLARQTKLAKRGIIPSARLEEAQEELRRGSDRVEVSKRRVQRVLAQLGGDPNRPIDQHPLVRQRLAALEAAKLELVRTRIRAPIDGQVVNLRLQPGEQIEAARPLLAIVADGQTWVEANFKETELTHVRQGMSAEVTLDIDPDTVWKAEVVSISPATGAEFALLPPQNASGNWVKVVQRLPVKLRLTPVAGKSAMLRAGMTASVSVDTKRQRSLASLLGTLSAKADSSR